MSIFLVEGGWGEEEDEGFSSGCCRVARQRTGRKRGDGIALMVDQLKIYLFSSVSTSSSISNSLQLFYCF